jgi:hypothetical protein
MAGPPRPRGEAERLLSPHTSAQALSRSLMSQPPCAQQKPAELADPAGHDRRGKSSYSFSTTSRGVHRLTDTDVFPFFSSGMNASFPVL